MSVRRRHRVAMANARRLRQTKLASRRARRPCASLNRRSRDDALIITEHDPLQTTSTMHDRLTEVLVQNHHRRQGDGPGRPTEAVPRCVLSRHRDKKTTYELPKENIVDRECSSGITAEREMAREVEEMKDIAVGFVAVQPKLSGSTTVQWRGGQVTATFCNRESRIDLD